MSTLKKSLVSGLFAMVAAGSFAAPAQAATPFALSMPGISVLTNQVGEQIAAALKAQLAEAIAAPRLQRSAHTASVIITESNAVVVEATRLPPASALAEADEANRTARVRF